MMVGRYTEVGIDTKKVRVAERERADELICKKVSHPKEMHSYFIHENNHWPIPPLLYNIHES